MVLAERAVHSLCVSMRGSGGREATTENTSEGTECEGSMNLFIIPEAPDSGNSPHVFPRPGQSSRWPSGTEAGNVGLHVLPHRLA